MGSISDTSVTQEMVYLFLQNNGPASVREIATHFKTKMPGIQKKVYRLYKDGLISRYVEDNPRYGSRVFIYQVKE